MLRAQATSMLSSSRSMCVLFPPLSPLSLRFADEQQALVSTCKFVLKLNMAGLMMRHSGASCIADCEVAALEEPVLPSQSGIFVGSRAIQLMPSYQEAFL